MNFFFSPRLFCHSFLFASRAYVRMTEDEIGVSYLGSRRKTSRFDAAVKLTSSIDSWAFKSALGNIRLI